MLDNFEQVVAAGPLLADLLQARRASLLVTSRGILHLYGEHEYMVAPLAVPDTEHLPASDQLTQYAAVALFIERARAVRPDFHVD